MMRDITARLSPRRGRRRVICRHTMIIDDQRGERCVDLRPARADSRTGAPAGPHQHHQEQTAVE